MNLSFLFVLDWRTNVVTEHRQTGEDFFLSLGNDRKYTASSQGAWETADGRQDDTEPEEETVFAERYSECWCGSPVVRYRHLSYALDASGERERERAWNRNSPRFAVHSNTSVHAHGYLLYVCLQGHISASWKVELLIKDVLEKNMPGNRNNRTQKT